MEDRHQIAPYPLRMPAEMRQRLEDEARRIGRSLHAEILARLESSFLPELNNDPPSDAQRNIRMLIVEEIENYLHRERANILRKP